MSHQAVKPPRTNKPVTIKAITTPAATVQSSPIIKSYQKAKNAVMKRTGNPSLTRYEWTATAGRTGTL